MFRKIPCLKKLLDSYFDQKGDSETDGEDESHDEEGGSSDLTKKLEEKLDSYTRWYNEYKIVKEMNEDMDGIIGREFDMKNVLKI